MKNNYVVIKEFKFDEETFEGGTILKMDEEGDYSDGRGNFFPAILMDNTEYFKEVKPKPEWKSKSKDEKLDFIIEGIGEIIKRVHQL